MKNEQLQDHMFFFFFLLFEYGAKWWSQLLLLGGVAVLSFIGVVQFSHLWWCCLPLDPSGWCYFLPLSIQVDSSSFWLVLPAAFPSWVVLISSPSSFWVLLAFSLPLVVGVAFSSSSFCVVLPSSFHVKICHLKWWCCRSLPLKLEMN